MINFDIFGKPYFGDVENLRIPYMGSKQKIAKELFEKMLEIKPKAKYFFDIFSGGGTMSFFALQIGLKVHYNEKQRGLVDLLNYILKRARNGEKSKYGLFPDDFYKFITREEFCKLKNEDSVKGQFARICYSFGNNQRGYLFGDIEELKHLGHNIVVFNCEKSLKEFNQKTSSNFVLSNNLSWNERRLDFMSQINNRSNYKELQRLEQLEQLPNFTITNLDFQDVEIETPIDQTIVYLDPPYRGTAKYLERYTLHCDIDNYFKNSPYTCFMSEYNAPHKVVFEIEKASLLNNSNLIKRKIVIEKLYWNER